MSITGIITRIIYSANNYCVFAIGETKVITKVFTYLCREGYCVTVTGTVKTHDKYGENLVANLIQLENIPLDYLYENIHKNCVGIGKSTVTLLHNTFGNDFINIMENNPESVKLVVKNTKRFEALQKYIVEYKNEVNKCLYLSKLDIDADFANIISFMDINKIEYILKNNPYLFIENTKATIQIVDNYLDKIDKLNDFIEYKKQAIIYTELIDFIKKTGGYYTNKNIDFIKNFNCEHKIQSIVTVDNNYTLQHYIDYENNINVNIKNITKKYNIVSDLITSDVITLTPEQIKAVELTIINPVTILTGGPGTGKSTTVKFIIKNLLNIYKAQEILLCALTGTAVNNIKNIVNIPEITTITIHRFLLSKEVMQPRVVIIDELSLVDVCIFSRFLSKCLLLDKLILVGDTNQIPSISPGQVLKDLILSGVIPHINLTLIQRQCAENTIISNAYKIINGENNLVFDNIYCTQVNEIKKDDIIKYYSQGNAHVIALTHTIVNKINEQLQELYNTNPIIEVKYGKNTFDVAKYKIGDKVKQTVNNYDLGVFNGQIGYITHIEGNVITVDFGEYIEYKGKNIAELNLAYATTIHSSQGCEFDTVIVIIKYCNFLLNRNVFYTAITRAKKRVIIVGDTKIIELAISKELNNRNTNLANILK